MRALRGHEPLCHPWVSGGVDAASEDSVCPSVGRQRGSAGATRAEFESVWLEKAASLILLMNINPFGC